MPEHPQLFNVGPVAIRPLSHKRGRSFVIATCRHPGCNKPRRPVQGATYCDEHARSRNYVIGLQGAPLVERVCQCGRTFTFKKNLRTSTTIGWWEFCPDCHSETPLTLGQLQNHHVPAELVREWLSHGSNLPCNVCHEPIRRKSAAGKPIIDHDHGCCPGGNSCGRCVRGVVHTRCNQLVGSYEAIDQTGMLPAILAYLKRDS